MNTFNQSMQRLCLILMLAALTPGYGFADETLEKAPPYIIVLGIAQDAGYPHIGCKKECCRSAWKDPTLKKFATSLALVDPASGQRWLFEATPDMPTQLQRLDEVFPVGDSPIEKRAPGLDGIFLTHAHIGHYTGLMHLGREALGGRSVPVYAMPRMRKFLAENGPWSQLVGLKNIELRSLDAGQATRLNSRLTVTPWLVPHRDEFSETVGYSIQGPVRSLLFIPDIDKWQKWKRNIATEITKHDFALLDGTFYANGELPGRNMSEIPHPFIVESISRLAELPATQKRKVHFIHLNHSNPALQANSEAAVSIKGTGFQVAHEMQRFGL